MKNCKDIEDNLPLYSDNLLSSVDKQAVEKHLKSCSGCAKALGQLQQTKKILNNLTEVEPPAWFKQKIMAEARQEAEKKSFIQKWFYPLGIKIPIQVFTTLVIAVLAFYIYRGGNEQMKEVLPLSVPAPVAKAQKEELPKQTQTESKLDKAVEPVKEKTIVDKKPQDEIVKNDLPFPAVAPKAEEVKSGFTQEKARQSDAVAKKDESRQDVSGIMAERYESSPAKSFAPPAAAKMKKSKKESNIADSAMNARSAPSAQSALKPYLSLKVENIDTAVKEVDKILSRYEAQKVTKQLLPNKAIFTAEIRIEDIKEFTASLRTIGRIFGRIVPGDNADKYIFVEIEIFD